ncbi:MAG: alpha/beta hydrolase [Pseudomonadota bacterium]
MDTLEIAELGEAHFRSAITYQAAVDMAQQLSPGAHLSCVEKAEIGLALADEQLGHEPDADASMEDKHRALVTLEAAESELAERTHWTSGDAIAAREIMVRLLDRQAILLMTMDRPVSAFLKASLARELATDFGEEDTETARERAELMMYAAQQTGRDEFLREAHDAMEETGLGMAMASHEEAVMPDIGDVDVGASAPVFEAPEPVAAPLPESFPDASAPAPETMRAPTPSARRRSRASRTAPPETEATEDADLPYHEVPVFFATHRNRSNRKNPYDFFRGKRADLSLGKAKVTVPKNREVGDFKVAKRSSWKTADKAKLITIDTIDIIGERSDFFSQMSSDIATSERKEALIFIHGYNTSFAGALMRAGQLSVDLDIDGATMMYSWPSKASFMSYVIDRNQVIAPFVTDLRDLIVEVALETGAERVHILGHSMGCQFLLDTLEKVLIHPKIIGKSEPIADEIIFASPDVDAEDFVGTVPDIRGLAKRITVYSSREDRALAASKLLWGSPRAGQSPERIGESGIDAIDTTAAEQDFLGHSDYSKSAIDDVRAVVWVPVDVPPAKRDAILKPGENGNYWVYRGDDAGQSGPPFREALVYLRKNGLEAAQGLLGGAQVASSAVAAIDDHVRAALRKLID